MFRCYGSSSYHTGTTLVELLVFLVLSTWLIAMVSHMWIDHLRAYQWLTHYQRMQNDLRFTFSYLQDNISEAGLGGCAHIENLVFSNHVQNPQWRAIHIPKALQLLTKAQWPKRTKAIGPILVIQKVQHDAQYLSKALNRPTGSIRLKAGLHIKKDALALIYTCNEAELFKVLKVRHNKQAHSTIISHWQQADGHRLNKKYDTHAKVGRYEVQAYYCAPTNIKDNNGQPLLGLYQDTLTGHRQLLISNIKGWQIDAASKPLSSEVLHFKSLDMMAKETPIVALKISITLNNAGYYQKSTKIIALPPYIQKQPTEKNNAALQYLNFH